MLSKHDRKHRLQVKTKPRPLGKRFGKYVISLVGRDVFKLVMQTAFSGESTELRSGSR